MKKKINKIIVVEGRDDTANLKRFYEVNTYETNGSSINQTDLERLKILHEKQGIIVFTDPDFQGERIRKIIMAAIPTAQHAFIQRDEGVPKSKSKGHSLGVEHADFTALEAALNQVETSVSPDRNENGLTVSDLMAYGLVMGADSRKRRDFLCTELRIGYANGKQLLKRLNMFGIGLDEVDQAMKKYGNVIQ
ncbi:MULTISPECIES: ribonuclease M5 [unclassified Lactococcus]|uniref:ribonuclease M5 n=1 Tax=unclassified Lactococcus TaxID=2643510 RepID=UPI0011CC0D44|nr:MULTISPECIES: ribonuclease M5 [unclassified Lactococcus]MQW22437.1 ribonuclease M5 [Lactococcus sp. dk101]TXK45466.1 ribonuclease M5 [Lactococcus sp. dk310]TXK51799.1 ribonuclease M5 [Lactococcus sp. dk322]